jgi:hypothetical protein
MVVLTFVTRPCARYRTSSSNGSSTPYASSPSGWTASRSTSVWYLPIVSETIRKPDCTCIWLCVLLSVCVLPGRGTRHVPGDFAPCKHMATQEGSSLRSGLMKAWTNQARTCTPYAFRLRLRLGQSVDTPPTHRFCRLRMHNV